MKKLKNLDWNSLRDATITTIIALCGIWFIFVVLPTFSSCNNSYPNDDMITPPIDTTNYNEHTMKFITYTEDHNTEISIWEIDRHEYIIAKISYGQTSISMVHSENCWCGK